MADVNDLDQNLWKLSIEIPLLNEKHALIACNSLRIDQEPRKSEVSRKFFVEENILKVWVTCATVPYHTAELYCDGASVKWF